MSSTQISDGILCLMFSTTALCIVLGAQRLREGNITFGFIAIPLGVLAVLYSARFLNLFDLNGQNAWFRVVTSTLGVFGTLLSLSLYALNGRVTKFMERHLFKGR